MAEKFIIAADRAHLRIYRYSQGPGQFTPSIQPVDAMDLPESRLSRADEELESADRYTDSPTRIGAMPLKEGVPVQQERRVTDELAAQIGAFMEKRPNSTWDLAAPSSIRNELIEALREPIRRRLDQVVSKDLVNVPPAELRAHFAL